MQITTSTHGLPPERLTGEEEEMGAGGHETDIPWGSLTLHCPPPPLGLPKNPAQDMTLPLLLRSISATVTWETHNLFL